MKDFVFNPVSTVEEAREQAINWQHWAHDRDMSWGEVAIASEYFTQLGIRFGLTEEFAENGIA